MKNKFKLYLILISALLLNSCGSEIKDALQGKRKSKSGDEFLIQKKNPLSLPPNFGDLPTPTEESDNVVESEDENIKKILSKKKSSNYNEEASAAESLILEELNSN
tara:strand:- start:101 stop:418 length:318 start_codon:yes stop_codon:yes gene_type:complete